MLSKLRMLFSWLPAIQGWQILLVAVLISSITAGWIGYHLGVSTGLRIEAEHAKALADDLNAMQQANEIIEKLLTKELDNATAKLRASQTTTAGLLLANQRLRINAVCETPADAAGDTSGDSGTRAELDPSARRAYYNLRNAIDLVEYKLDSCQKILSTLKGQQP